jgi:hypothetical protein
MTTLPAKGIGQNCLVVIFATAVALAMDSTNYPSAHLHRFAFAFALPTASPSPLLIAAFSTIPLRANKQSP